MQSKSISKLLSDLKRKKVQLARRLHLIVHEENNTLRFCFNDAAAKLEVRTRSH